MFGIFITHDLINQERVGDRDFLLEIFQQQGMARRYTNERLRNNRAFVLAAAQEQCRDVVVPSFQRDV